MHATNRAYRPESAGPDRQPTKARAICERTTKGYKTRQASLYFPDGPYNVAMVTVRGVRALNLSRLSCVNGIESSTRSYPLGCAEAASSSGRSPKRGVGPYRPHIDKELSMCAAPRFCAGRARTRNRTRVRNHRPPVPTPSVALKAPPLLGEVPHEA